MSRRGQVSSRIDRALAEVLESRRLLCAIHDDSAEPLAGPLPAMAWPEGQVDHSVGWYAPAGEVSLASLSSSGSAGAPLGSEPLAAPGGTTLYPTTFSVNAAGLPLLTSRADGQGLKIFLDFDGYSTNLPFDLDGNTATFNTDEQRAIYDTWRDMISYFSALNVNVTTVQPPTGGSNQVFAWHLTSNSISGGYAYVGWLTNDQPRGFNQGSNAVSRRSGIAHEIGHLLNLYHQGEYDKLGVILPGDAGEYTDGWDNRNRSVIGIDYRENVRQWFYGRSSSGVTSMQDDLLTMANKVKSVVGGDGYRPDDYGNTTAAAYVLPTGTQRVEAFIERYTDADVFQFTSTGERWHIDATPTFESSVEPKLELLDLSGNVIAAADNADQRGGGINHNDVEFTLDLSPGEYFVRVSSSGDISELGEYLLTASPFMSGWLTQDVATLYRPGTASFNPSSGEIVQLGGGTDIWSTSDQFRFSYSILNGDGSITVRVDSLDNTDPSAKAGVMIRQSLSSNSAHVLLNAKPSGSLEMIRRTGAGGTAASVSIPASVGPWLRLTRSGSNFTAARSDNGVDWTTLATTSVSMSGPVYMGLATNSHSARYAAYATFSNLSVTGSLGAVAPTYNVLPAPTGVSAAPAAGANTSIVLNWTDISGETGYAIERSADGVNFSQIATVAANVATYTDANVWGSMRWFYRVSSRDGSANNSVPSAVVSTVNKPRAVANPPSSYARPFSSSSTTLIQLNWTDVQGDNGYKVERSTDNVNFSLITTRPANYNAHNDSGLTPGQVYYYRITPVTSVGDGVAPSFTITAGTQLAMVSGLSFTSKQPTSMSLQWNNIQNETGYRVERSTTGSIWSTAATLGADVTTWTDTNVSPLSEYYYRVVGLNSISGMESTAVSSVIFAASPASTALPSGWVTQDVGSVSGTGAAGYNAGTWTLLGSGSDISSSSDQFRFAYRTLSGNGEVIARVTSVENTDSAAKAGVMIRDTLNANSRNAFIAVTPGSGVDFQYRSSTNGNTTVVDGPAMTAPAWVKLARSGNVFTAYWSNDGSSWTQFAQQSVTMGSSVYVGLALTSRTNAALAAATFSNVIAGNQPPTINSVSANPSTVDGTSTQLNVSATDDGGAANLQYQWTNVSWPGGVAAPTFSVNNSNAASSTTATFSAAGQYSFRVNVSDTEGLNVDSSLVNVTVNATATSVVVTPTGTGIDPGAQAQFGAAVIDQFGAGIPTALVTWSASAGSIDANGLWTAPAQSGPVIITATHGILSDQVNASVNLSGQAAAFNVDQSPQQIRFAFNGDISASLSNTDLELLNLDGNTQIDSQNIQASFDANAGIATFTIANLPDGNFRATLPAGSVADPFGNALLSNLSVEFAYLAADANGDGAVNTLDFNIVASNYGGSGKVFSEGNFNYDALGEVDSLDFNLFIGQYGKRLIVPPAGAAPLFSGLPDSEEDPLFA